MGPGFMLGPVLLALTFWTRRVAPDRLDLTVWNVCRFRYTTVWIRPLFGGNGWISFFFFFLSVAHRQMDHLVCFLAGTLALGAQSTDDEGRAERDMKTAKAR